MSIPEWLDMLLDKVNNPDKVQLIRDVLELGDITPYNGNYTKMINLTAAYEKKTGDRQYLGETFSNYATPEDVLLMLKDTLDSDGSVIYKLASVKSLLRNVDIERSDVFFVQDTWTLETATKEGLNEVRDELIKDLIRYEESVNEAN